MSKARKWLLTVLTVLFATFCSLFAISCAQEEGTGGFSLDRNKVTVRVGEDAEVVRVLRDGEEYTGPVAWATLDKQYLSVSQGYVTGVSQGEGVATATVFMGDKSYTLRCEVTVKAELSATAEDIFTYAGVGNVDVSIGKGLLSARTTIDKVTVSKNLGDENALTLTPTEDDEYFLTNTAANPLDVGVYYVTYVISVDGESKETVREVTVRGADKYEDLFILAAIDQTEFITGSAANATYTVTGMSENVDPGEYVTYTDQMTQPKGMNQTKAEFLQSLKDSGYDGYLDENTLGYDTVYRLYNEKGNASDPPYPYYYVNVWSSANPVWSNLSDLPQDATVDIWARLWFKELGSNEYVAISGGTAALYKNMNSGAVRVEGSTQVAAYDSVGGWSKYSVPLAKCQEGLYGAKNLALKIDRGGTGLIGSFYLELYSVELTVGASLTAPFGEVDVELTGGYTGLLDDYSWQIVSSKGETEIVAASSENQTGTLVKGLVSGEYVVRYVVADKGWTVEKPLVSGVLNNFTATLNLGSGGWHGDNSPTLVELSDVGLPTPQSVGYEGPLTKTTVLEVTAASDGQSSPYIPLNGLFEKIDDYGETAHVELWVYFDAATPFTMTSMSLYAAESSGWSSNSSVDTGKGVSSFVSSIGSNQWAKLKIFLSDIKKSMEEGETYNGLGFYFRPGANGIRQNVYYYSAEFRSEVKPSGATYLTDTTVINRTAWGTTSRLSVVDTSQEIGVPTGKHDAGRLVSYTTDGSNQTMFEVRSTFYSLQELLTLNDNDSVRFWIYVKGEGVSVNAYTLWSGIERDWNKRGDGVTIESSVAANQWQAWDVKISEIKEAQKNFEKKAAESSWNATARTTMMIKLAANAPYTLYFHSLEIVKS